MHFILIVINFFSFYDEFEILLHFVLDFMYWSLNEDINVRNEDWSKMDRICTKKSSGRHFLDKIAERNYQNYGPQSWELLPANSVKKWLELRTVIIDAGSANLNSKSGFLKGSKGEWTPSSKGSLNTLKIDPKQKEKENTIEEEIGKEELKNRTRNRRSSWCILSFTFFSCCAVVYRSLCNF
jgi:hypothetical protein